MLNYQIQGGGIPVNKNNFHPHQDLYSQTPNNV